MPFLKILLVGAGAREHALALALKRSQHPVKLFVVGKNKNPGLVQVATEYLQVDVGASEAIRAFARANKISFAVIGPENPLAGGLVDALAEDGIPAFGPRKTVARLESSKSFTRDLLEKYQIPGNPRYRIFTEADPHILRSFMAVDLAGEFVVKADDLQGGKGVKVSGDHLLDVEEGVTYALECLQKAGRVVVEEKFIGQEFSLMSFCDGESTVDMPAIQDHKRVFVGDRGPNTGGMGSYSDVDHSLPFLSPEDLQEASAITKAVAKALNAETGYPFKGVLYGGFITTAKGVRLIEYNARFGDPEAINALAILRSDFVDICLAVINGTLNQISVKFATQATVCKYLVPEGYPDNSLKDRQIIVPSQIPPQAQIFYGSVDLRDQELYLQGSRALAVVAYADSISEAEEIAETVASQVQGPVFHRPDIGTAPLLAKRIAMMSKLRG